MPTQIKRNNPVSSFSVSKNEQLIWKNKIVNLSANIAPKAEIITKRAQLSDRSSQRTSFSSPNQMPGKSYSQRQKDNMSEGVLYGAGAYAALFGACAVASGTFMTAPISVPAALLGLSLVSTANALRKAYDISQEK